MRSSAPYLVAPSKGSILRTRLLATALAIVLALQPIVGHLELAHAHELAGTRLEVPNQVEIPTPSLPALDLPDVNAYAAVAGQIVDALVSGELTWEEYKVLMEEHPELRHKVAPIVGLRPDGTIYVRDIAITAALLVIPMGKLAQLGEKPAAALLDRRCVA